MGGSPTTSFPTFHLSALLSCWLMRIQPILMWKSLRSAKRMYCLLPHSSHITQPLDVGFLVLSSWVKAVDKYKIAHMGFSVTKETFASVFNTTWTGAVKMSTIVCKSRNIPKFRSCSPLLGKQHQHHRLVFCVLIRVFIKQDGVRC